MEYSMWYNVDWNILGIENLPGFFRLPRLKAFVTAFHEVIYTVYNLFKSNRADNLFKLAHTGQIFSVEKVLNDKLDTELRRIYIADGDDIEMLYIYTATENKDLILGEVIIYPEGSYVDGGVDFKVFVPLEVIDQQYHRLKSLIDFYKLDVKKYSINPIQ